MRTSAEILQEIQFTHEEMEEASRINDLLLGSDFDTSWISSTTALKDVRQALVKIQAELAASLKALATEFQEAL